jgi:hypothetical protein
LEARRSSVEVSDSLAEDKFKTPEVDEEAIEAAAGKSSSAEVLLKEVSEGCTGCSRPSLVLIEE